MGRNAGLLEKGSIFAIMNHKAFTLIELLIVIIIIGILASIALPNFAGMKEKALDKEAIANLKLIQGAQKIYRMETGSYYDSGGSNNTNINQNLKLSLPAGVNSSWLYATASSSGCSIATRNDGVGRHWRIFITEEEPVSCMSGCGCP